MTLASATIDEYLSRLRETFRPERSEGRRAVVQYEFTGREAGNCHMVIADGTIIVERGTFPNPDVTVKVDFDTWLRIVTYQIDPLIAGQDGLFAVDGDAMLLMESDMWFER